MFTEEYRSRFVEGILLSNFEISSRMPNGSVEMDSTNPVWLVKFVGFLEYEPIPCTGTQMGTHTGLYCTECGCEVYPVERLFRFSTISVVEFLDGEFQETSELLEARLKYLNTGKEVALPTIYQEAYDFLVEYAKAFRKSGYTGNHNEGCKYS